MPKKSTQSAPPRPKSPAHSMGERLGQARRRAGLPLSHLSVLTDYRLSKSRISNYEQGIRRLPVDVAQILAPILQQEIRKRECDPDAAAHVTAAWLLGVDDREATAA